MANCATATATTVSQTILVPLTACQVSEVPWMLRMKNRWKISITTRVFTAMVRASSTA